MEICCSVSRVQELKVCIHQTQLAGAQKANYNLCIRSSEPKVKAEELVMARQVKMHSALAKGLR